MMNPEASPVAVSLMRERSFAGIPTYWLRLFQTATLLALSALGIRALILVSFSEQPFTTLLLQFLTAFIFSCNVGSFHDAGHFRLFRSRAGNILYGRFFGLLITLSSTSYRLTHALHHQRLLAPNDLEFWPYCDTSTSARFRRIFSWVDLFFGRVTGPLVYTRIFWSQEAILSPASHRQIRLELLSIFLFWGTLFAWVTYQGIWLGFTRAWLIPQFLAGIFQTLNRFLEHLGRPQGDGLACTRTIRPTRFLDLTLASLTLQTSHGGIHHVHPAIPARDLEFFAREASPPFQADFQSHAAAMADVFKTLWRSPDSGQLRS